MNWHLAFGVEFISEISDIKVNFHFIHWRCWSKSSCRSFSSFVLFESFQWGNGTRWTEIRVVVSDEERISFRGVYTAFIVSVLHSLVNFGVHICWSNSLACLLCNIVTGVFLEHSHLREAVHRSDTPLSLHFHWEALRKQQKPKRNRRKTADVTRTKQKNSDRQKVLGRDRTAWTNAVGGIKLRTTRPLNP